MELRLCIKGLQHARLQVFMVLLLEHILEYVILLVDN
jgi:hypothetical protein